MQLTKKLAEYADGQNKKKMRSDGYKNMSLEDYIENAKKRTMDYNEKWKDSNHLDDLVKIQTLLKMLFWKAIRMGDGYLEQIERVFPIFWKLLQKALKKTNDIPWKGKIQDSIGSYKTILPAFCKLAVDISKSKATNILSTQRQKKELEGAGITEELILI